MYRGVEGTSHSFRHLLLRTSKQSLGFSVLLQLVLTAKKGLDGFRAGWVEGLGLRASKAFWDCRAQRLMEFTSRRG